MLSIEDPRVEVSGKTFSCTCTSCGSRNIYSTKNTALKSLARGNCKVCKKDYRTVRDQKKDSLLGIYKNTNGFWCSLCSGCGKEQAYTRKDHAKNSARGDWKCKSCAVYDNKIRPSFYQEFRLVDIESFEKNAISRGLSWELSLDTVPTLWSEQGGKCNLSGLTLVKHPRTWSLDRIDSSRGYEVDNVQLVEKRVNMAKGTLSQEEFISLCTSVTKNVDQTK